MCLFKYREKRYGKLTFILFSLIMIALGLAAGLGGVVAVVKMEHWAKYVIVSIAGLVGLFLIGWGLFMFIISFSMTGRSKSVRDVNKGKGVSGVRLCDKCGRVISKNAKICEHCGIKQESGLGVKKCPNCKTKNSAQAHFCEECGYDFHATNQGE